MSTFINFICSAKTNKNANWIQEQISDKMISAVSHRAAAEIYATNNNLTKECYHVVITRESNKEEQKFLIEPIVSFTAIYE